MLYPNFLESSKELVTQLEWIVQGNEGENSRKIIGITGDGSIVLENNPKYNHLLDHPEALPFIHSALFSLVLSGYNPSQTVVHELQTLPQVPEVLHAKTPFEMGLKSSTYTFTFTKTIGTQAVVKVDEDKKDKVIYGYRVLPSGRREIPSPILPNTYGTPTSLLTIALFQPDTSSWVISNLKEEQQRPIFILSSAWIGAQSPRELGAFPEPERTDTNPQWMESIKFWEKHAFAGKEIQYQLPNV